MNTRADIASFACLAMLFCGGCSGATTATGSPLRSFEKVVARIKNALPDKDLSYDVQQTKSLVTPYTANVILRHYEPSEVADVKYLGVLKIVGDYVFQDDKWACKQVVLTVDGVEFVSGNRTFFAEVEASHGKDVGTVLKAWEGVELQTTADSTVSALRDAP
jgi:hypothetical protein